MRNAERYPFAPISSAKTSFRPSLPLALTYQQNPLNVSGLLDTGASVNVMPYPVGIALGFSWERQTTALSLTGNLAQFEARVVLVQATVAQFKSVQIVFAWNKLRTFHSFLGKSTSSWSLMYVFIVHS
jgi:hypothetical protein